jgi:hypothetical protein
MNPLSGPSIKATARILQVALTRILHYCDLYHLQVLALWVPREQNTFADYLSHLSMYLDRSTVSGHFRNESRQLQLSVRPSSNYLKSINQKYAFYTIGQGHIANPPTYQSIGSFVAKFAVDYDGSSKSIANIISGIKTMCHIITVP